MTGALKPQPISVDRPNRPLLHHHLPLNSQTESHIGKHSHHCFKRNQHSFTRLCVVASARTFASRGASPTSRVGIRGRAVVTLLSRLPFPSLNTYAGPTCCSRACSVSGPSSGRWMPYQPRSREKYWRIWSTCDAFAAHLGEPWAMCCSSDSVS